MDAKSKFLNYNEIPTFENYKKMLMYCLLQIRNKK